MNRRTDPRLASGLHFGPFVLDPAQARLSREGQPVALTGRAFDVLVLLVARAGHLVSKEEVLDGVWGHRHVTEAVLKVAVNVLRQALGDDARAPTYVETVPRKGYRFVAAVSAAAAGAAAATRVGMPVGGPRPDAPMALAPAADVLLGNLPLDGGVLVGREAEAALLTQLLAAHRLVTLTGLGGVGKTRLALSVAAQGPAPVDGRWLLRLDDLAEPERLLPTLAQRLQLGPKAATDAVALARTLARHQALLVLDNAEHIVEAVATLVAALQDWAPGVRVLVTSQTPLRVRGEQLLPLLPLALPADLADTAPEPSAYAAARLLCERVVQQQAGWRPTTADHADIAAICRALDGVPLALELAAARVPLLGLAAVRARLDQRFALLTRGPRDAAARHRTLTAALAWTFGLLSPTQLQGLQRLAVFAGSFDPEDGLGVLADTGVDTVADTCADHDADRNHLVALDDAMEVLDELRARSLLVTDAAAGGPGSGPRLRLYDSVRRHALAGLGESGREQDARLRHLRWVCRRFELLHVADVHEPVLHWMARLRPDVESLRAALHFGLAPAAPAGAQRLARRLVADSMPYWARSNTKSEGLHWLTQARLSLQQSAAATASDDDTAAWLDMAHGGLVASAVLGDPALSLQDFRRGRAVLLAAGGLDTCRLYMSYRYEYALMLRTEPQGDRLGTLRRMAACLPPPGTAMVRRHLRMLQALEARDRGRPAKYLSIGQELVALARAEDDTYACWNAQSMVGQALVLSGRFDQGCAEYASAVADMRARGMLREQVAVPAMAASLHLQRRLDAASRALALEALRLLASEGMVWWMADPLAWAAWHDGRPQDAARLMAWADGLAAGRGEKRGPVFAAMRQALVQHLAQLPEGHLPYQGGPALTGEAQALDLALGPGTSAAVLPVVTVR